MTTSVEALLQRLEERTTERDYHKRVGDMLAARIQVLEADQDPASIACREVAIWMMKNGYVTGHGDTLNDLLTELVISVKEETARAIEEKRNE